MDEFENLVTESLRELLAPDKLMVQLIENQFQKKGIVLEEEQKESLRSQLGQPEVDRIVLNIDDQQRARVEKGEIEDLFLNLGDLDNIETKLEKTIGETLDEISLVFSDAILESWQFEGREILQEQNQARTQFLSEVEHVWGEPLDLLDTLHSVCLEAGDRFNDHFRSSAAEDADLVFETITRLHARGCQVGGEILLLLRNGFADGAHARWRTLHEICVEARFIADHSQHVAERYLLHHVVGDYQRAKLYEQHHKALGYKPPDPVEIEQTAIGYQEVLNRFGKEFKSDYGWATEALGKKRPLFTDIEKAAGVSFMRPFYTFCVNIV